MHSQLAEFVRSLLHHNTPLEAYRIGNRVVWVKREDLCAPEGAPKFSKLRGVAAHLASRPESVIGVLDTVHSQGGWAVSYLAAQLGKRVVNFYPQFKLGEVRPMQNECQRLGAELYPLKPGRSFILYNQARRLLREGWPDSYMMPNALKLAESVEETAIEVRHRELLSLVNGTWVVSISSGTIAAGVVKGLAQAQARPLVILHLGYSRPEAAARAYVHKMAGCTMPVELVDEGYDYRDAVDFPVEFPCNEYYDRKAYKWLVENLDRLIDPVVFWNIG